MLADNNCSNIISRQLITAFEGDRATISAPGSWRVKANESMLMVLAYPLMLQREKMLPSLHSL